MFPFHQFQPQSLSFSHSNHNQIFPTPISDIESESKSVNGDLCQSFEGLFSKEVEESTMSSEWSRKGCEKAAASKLDYKGESQQGENEENIYKKLVKERVGKNLKVFQKVHEKLKEKKAEIIPTTPTSDQLPQEKIQLQQSQPSTNQLSQQQKRNKLSKYRSLLLPHPCYTKLPPSLLHLLQISTKIDTYLQSKKPALYTDNLFNIFKTLFSDEEMSTIWSNVKKLMFISKDHYRVRVDPLKNLCLGLGEGKVKGEERKVKLRKLMGEYYYGNRKVVDEVGVPEAYVEPIKTARFYPQNLNLCPQIFPTTTKKVSKKYMAKLQQSALSKQSKLQQLEQKCQPIAPATPQPSNSQPLPLPSQLQHFCNTIISIYQQRKVSHMYKSSLIQHVRKNTSFSLEKIFFFIKYITQEELFLEVMVKEDGCKIFGVVGKEIGELMRGLKQKRGE